MSKYTEALAWLAEIAVWAQFGIEHIDHDHPEGARVKLQRILYEAKRLTDKQVGGAEAAPPWTKGQAIEKGEAVLSWFEDEAEKRRTP